MFIGDGKRRKKVKCIQANSTAFKELSLISKKDFIIKDMSNEDNEMELDSEKEENFEDKFKVDF